MHGELQLDSSLGRGSRFRVRLPVEPIPQCPAAGTENRASAATDAGTTDLPGLRPSRADLQRPCETDTGKALHGRRILVVEDNAVNQVLVTAHLKQSGCVVLIASDGSEAVAVCREQAVDLILMDCRMPVMDGFEATRTIRSGGGPSARAPIIALTANNMPGDRDACFAAGMNDFVPKPFSREQLLSAVLRHLNA